MILDSLLRLFLFPGLETVVKFDWLKIEMQSYLGFESMSSNLRPLELEIVKKMFPFHISTGNMTPSALSGSKRFNHNQQILKKIF